MQQETVQPELQGGTTTRLPLSALLSQLLVAFTLEYDNEFEHQMPHRTTNHGRTGGSRDAPWLVSLVMWSNCMQFVGEEGVTLGALQHLARTETNLAGMQRWGYIVVEPVPTHGNPKRPHPDMIIRATPAGRKAQEVWRPLSGVIEQRWRERFGNKEIDLLRQSLEALFSQFAVELYVVVEPEAPGSRMKVLVLTPKGRYAQDTYHRVVWAIEDQWQAHFDKDVVRTLREALERVVGEPTAHMSLLCRGLEPYPDGWRASVRSLDTLPHYPMVLHRGGFPDGS